MHIRLLKSLPASAAIVSVLVLWQPATVTVANEADAPSAKPNVETPKTAWGEPDLQGIWTDETNTPLQRPAK